MDTLETLDRRIASLRQSLSRCWRDVSSGGLGAYERSELRSQMVRLTGELRLSLQAYDAETRRLRTAHPVSREIQPVQLRVLNTDYETMLPPAQTAAASMAWIDLP